MMTGEQAWKQGAHLETMERVRDDDGQGSNNDSSDIRKKYMALWSV